MRKQWGEDTGERTTAHRLAGAAALTGRDDDGTESAWGMGDGTPALGPMLDFGHRHDVDRLHLFVDVAGDEAGAVARRANAFRLPVTVWSVGGTELVEADPLPLAAPPPLAEAVQSYRGMLEAAGADVVVEEGMLRAEVLGLEVARVRVDDNDENGEPRLEIGVGRHDREARALLGADEQPSRALSEVVAAVAGLRRAGAAVHPANQLAPERWLRSVVMAEPSLARVRDLQARASPVPRPDLKRPAPAPALGVGLDGEPVVVVCSVGVDPELVPLASDARMAGAVELGRDAGQVGLVLVVPDGDDYRLTRELAGLLRHPATVTTVPADWRSRLPR